MWLNNVASKNVGYCWTNNMLASCILIESTLAHTLKHWHFTIIRLGQYLSNSVVDDRSNFSNTSSKLFSTLLFFFYRGKLDGFSWFDVFSWVDIFSCFDVFSWFGVFSWFDVFSLLVNFSWSCLVFLLITGSSPLWLSSSKSPSKMWTNYHGGILMLMRDIHSTSLLQLFV